MAEFDGVDFAVSAALKRLAREGNDLRTIAGVLGLDLEDVKSRVTVPGGHRPFTPTMKAAYSSVLREFARRQPDWVEAGTAGRRRRVSEALAVRAEADDFAEWETEMGASS